MPEIIFGPRPASEIESWLIDNVDVVPTALGPFRGPHYELMCENALRSRFSGFLHYSSMRPAPEDLSFSAYRLLFTERNSIYLFGQTEMDFYNEIGGMPYAIIEKRTSYTESNIFRLGLELEVQRGISREDAASNSLSYQEYLRRLGLLESGDF